MSPAGVLAMAEKRALTKARKAAADAEAAARPPPKKKKVRGVERAVLRCCGRPSPSLPVHFPHPPPSPPTARGARVPPQRAGGAPRR